MNFRNEFERESRRLPVPDTDIATVITTARRRTRRRRVTASTVAVVALVVGTAIGIQQLSGVRTTNPNMAPPPAPTLSPDYGTAPTTTIVFNGGRYLDLASQFHLDNAVPAQLAPANVTWSVLDANSPEALPLRFGSSASQRYALATLPSASPDKEPQEEEALFERIDGKWNRVNFNDPGIVPTVSGDTVYGIGTAPATAGGPEGSFGTFDVASGKWLLHELPERARPYVSKNVTSDQSVDMTAIDGGAIAVISIQNWIDPSTLSDAEQLEQWRVEGNTLHTYTNCNLEMIFGYLSTTPNYTEADYDRVYQENCTDTVVDATKLGFSQADLDALKHDQRWSVWKVTADSIVPFESPELVIHDGDSVYLTDNVLTVTRQDRSEADIFSINNDGSLTRIFADLPQDQRVNGESISTSIYSVGRPAVGRLGRYLLTPQPDSRTQVIDLAPSVTAPGQINPTLSITGVDRSPTLIAAGATLQYDRVGTLSEPTTITDGGYSLEMTPDGYRVIDNSTGFEPDFPYDFSTDTGKVELLMDRSIPVPTTVGLQNIVPAPSIAPSLPDSGVLAATVPATSPTPFANPPTTLPYDIATGGSTTADSTTSNSLQSVSTPSTTLLPGFEHVATFDVDWKTVPGLSIVRKELVFTSVDGINVAVNDVDSIVRAAMPLGDDEVVNLQSTTIDNDGRVILGVVVYGGRYGDEIKRELMVVGTPN